MIKIDKIIPIPESKRKNKYPFATMKKGDSFFMPSTPEDIGKLRSNLLASAARHGKFTTRQEGNGIRIWRIK